MNLLSASFKSTLMDWYVKWFVTGSGEAFKPKSTTTTDTAVYFVSARREMGLLGWRYASKFKPVRLNRGANPYFVDQDMQYLSDHRRPMEPRVFIGDREHLMKKLRFLKDRDFDEATSVEVLRARDATAYIELIVNDIPHPIHVFTTWLKAQIECGLTEFNGIVLQDHTTSLGVGRFQSTTKERFKECEPEDYLKIYQESVRRHYDANPLSAELERSGGYLLPTLDELARQFLKEQTSAYLGLSGMIQQNDVRKMAIEVYNRKSVPVVATGFSDTDHQAVVDRVTRPQPVRTIGESEVRLQVPR